VLFYLLNFLKMTEAQAKKEALNRVDKNICYKFAEKE
jgi:hypothetical protein